MEEIFSYGEYINSAVSAKHKMCVVGIENVYEEKNGRTEWNIPPFAIPHPHMDARAIIKERKKNYSCIFHVLNYLYQEEKYAICHISKFFLFFQSPTPTPTFDLSLFTCFLIFCRSLVPHTFIHSFGIFLNLLHSSSLFIPPICSFLHKHINIILSTTVEFMLRYCLASGHSTSNGKGSVDGKAGHKK